MDSTSRSGACPPLRQRHLLLLLRPRLHRADRHLLCREPWAGYFRRKNICQERVHPPEMGLRGMCCAPNRSSGSTYICACMCVWFCRAGAHAGCLCLQKPSICRALMFSESENKCGGIATGWLDRFRIFLTHDIIRYYDTIMARHNVTRMKNSRYVAGCTCRETTLEVWSTPMRSVSAGRQAICGSVSADG